MDKQELVGKLYELEAENAQLKARAQEVCEWVQIDNVGCDVSYRTGCNHTLTVKEYDFDDNYCRICGRKIELKAGEENG